MRTLDHERDDDIRPEDERAEDLPEGPRPSPWEPPRDDAPLQEPSVTPADEPTPAPVAPQPEEDFFAGLNAPPTPEAGPAEPPFVVTERDLGGVGEPKAPSKAATFVAFAVVVMAVLGVLMAIAAVKLFFERAEMSAALGESVDRLSAVYAGPGTSDTSKRRIAWLQKSIDQGDYAQAQNAIESLGTPEIDRPSPLDTPGVPPGGGDGTDEPGGGPDRRLPSPEEDTNLPLKAQVFFEQHPELWEAFFGFTVTIKQMEQREMPIKELAELRSQMISAAEFGQTQKVEDLLNQAREKIEGMGPGNLPPALQEKLKEFGQAMQQAQKERRDVRAAIQLAQKSERAAQQGDLKRAESLMDRAIAALKSAPRMRMPRRPSGFPPGGRMPQMGPEIGLMKLIADLAGNVMRAEDRDLTQIWESINIAAGAIREKNAEQVREILQEAKDALHTIGDRRREMSTTIAQAQQRLRDARAEAGDGQRPSRPSEDQQDKRRQIIVRRVAGILAQVRDMPEEEFEANRAEIAQAVLKAMTAPVQMPPGELQGPELTPEERVRRKMEIAGEIYHQLKEQSDGDTTELDAKFSKVRELITEHEYEQAEELVDEAVEMMRGMVEDMPPAEDGEPGDDGGYGPQLQFDAPAPSLDLRSTGGDDASGITVPTDGLRAAPGDVETSDDTNEGVEQ